MNKLLVIKDLAYGAQQGGGTVGDIMDQLAVGAFAIFDEAGDLIPAAADLSDIVGLGKVTVAVGRTNDQNYVHIPRKNVILNRQDYRAAVKPVITIDTITSSEDSGDVTLTIYDSSFTSRFNIRRNSQSVYKTAGMTVEATMDKLLAKVNADKNFPIVMAKTDADTYTVTPEEDDVAIEVAVGGIFNSTIASTTITTTTAMIPSANTGAEILQIEKDFSVEEGSSNAISFGSEYYNRPMETVASSNYDVFNIVFEGIHDTPSQKKSVMHNTVKLALVDGASTFTADALETILRKVFQTESAHIDDFEALP